MDFLNRWGVFHGKPQTTVATHIAVGDDETSRLTGPHLKGEMLGWC